MNMMHTLGLKRAKYLLESRYLLGLQCLGNTHCIEKATNYNTLKIQINPQV